MIQWPLQSECDDFYGNPRGLGDKSNPAWEKEYLVPIFPLWRMIDEDSKQQVKLFFMHRKVRDSINLILMKIWDTYYKSQDNIEAVNLHLFSGAYVFRNIRDKDRLSMHAYGCAIDLAASVNYLGLDEQDESDTERQRMHQMPLDVIDIFEGQGWIWGGRWHGRPDPMHFQAAIVG
jgi:hypothetical protein